MTIHEAVSQIEAANYTAEELIILLEYYIQASTESWRKPEDIDNARKYTIALKQEIRGRMSH